MNQRNTHMDNLISPNKNGIWRHRLALASGLSGIMLGACSDGANTGESRSKEPTLNGSSSARVSATTNSEAKATSPSEEENFSYAITVSAPPLATCTVRPEGVTDDPARTSIVPADAEGEVRFYPPRKAWGSRLTVECGLNEGAKSRHVVDLNDSSTFGRKSSSEIAARRTGVRPALQGDLSAMSLSDLLVQGYPPRPDAVQSPKKYANWVQGVTRPIEMFAAVPVAMLGHKAGTYEGTYDSPPINGWTGFVQTASGFTGYNSSLGGDPANAGTLYDVYEAVISVPTSLCNAPMPYCGTALWAGIGGYPTTFFGILSPELIQSGITLQGTGIANTHLFAEYTPGGSMEVPLPPGDQLSVGDQVEVWGWSATDKSCATISSGGQFACFGYQDFTANWALSYKPQPATGGIWFPTTAEYVAEKPTDDEQASNYDYAIIEGGAFDSNLTWHADPGSGTDPYIYVEQIGASSKPISTAEWDNGTVNSPADPMFFVWNSFE